MKVSHRKKNRRQAAYRKSAAALKLSPICRNCGEPGPHFVPPCFGGPGFYMCEKKED